MDTSFMSSGRSKYAYNRKEENRNQTFKRVDRLLLQCQDGSEYKIKTGVTTIGTGEFCDVICKGAGISGVHCIFEISESGYPVCF
jgi:hypothetical protein